MPWEDVCVLNQTCHEQQPISKQGMALIAHRVGSKSPFHCHYIGSKAGSTAGCHRNGLESVINLKHVNHVNLHTYTILNLSKTLG